MILNKSGRPLIAQAARESETRGGAEGRGTACIEELTAFENLLSKTSISSPLRKDLEFASFVSDASLMMFRTSIFVAYPVYSLARIVGMWTNTKVPIVTRLISFRKRS